MKTLSHVQQIKFAHSVWAECFSPLERHLFLQWYGIRVNMGKREHQEMIDGVRLPQKARAIKSLIAIKMSKN